MSVTESHLLGVCSATDPRTERRSVGAAACSDERAPPPAAHTDDARHPDRRPRARVDRPPLLSLHPFDVAPAGGIAAAHRAKALGHHAAAPLTRSPLPSPHRGPPHPVAAPLTPSRCRSPHPVAAAAASSSPPLSSTPGPSQPRHTTKTEAGRNSGLSNVPR